MIVPCAQPAWLEDLGDRTDGPRSADRAFPAGLAERLLDRLKLEARGELGLVHSLPADLAIAEELLREADAAHVHAVHRDRFEGVADDELRAPSADVDDQAPRGGACNSMRDAEVDQARLFLAGDDLDVMAESLARVVEDFVRVAGFPERVGADGPDLLGAEIPEPLSEEREALDGALLRVRVEPAVVLKARSEADRLPNAIDDLDAAVIDPGNHHVKAVRTEVYCSKRLHARPRGTLA